MNLGNAPRRYFSNSADVTGMKSNSLIQTEVYCSHYPSAYTFAINISFMTHRGGWFLWKTIAFGASKNIDLLPLVCFSILFLSFHMIIGFCYFLRIHESESFSYKVIGSITLAPCLMIIPFNPTPFELWSPLILATLLVTIILMWVEQMTAVGFMFFINQMTAKRRLEYRNEEAL